MASVRNKTAIKAGALFRDEFERSPNEKFILLYDPCDRISHGRIPVSTECLLEPSVVEVNRGEQIRFVIPNESPGITNSCW